MWINHWGLARDPFAVLGSPYVSLPSHDEAIARLVYAVETGQPHVILEAAAGLGKTTVLRQAAGRVRGPRRQIVMVSGPLDDAGLLRQLALGLGAHVSGEASRALAWKSLERALRVYCLEGFQVILAVDDCRDGVGDLARMLTGLARPARSDGRGVTLVELRGDAPDQSATDDQHWALHALLKPLTRSETGDFLEQKLEAAGRRNGIFTARAITRLHAHCAGVPRGLERLAMLCLAAGAARGMDAISPDIVDGVALEWPLGCSSTCPPEAPVRWR